jgi:hypothetical protein
LILATIAVASALCILGTHWLFRGTYYQGESVLGYWRQKVDDPDPDVRAKAIEALCLSLRSRWRHERFETAKVFKTIQMDNASGRNRMKVAVPALMDSLQHDEENYIRYCAATTLGKIGPGAIEAVPKLEAIASNDQEWGSLREAAAYAAERIKGMSEVGLQ